MRLFVLAMLLALAGSHLSACDPGTNAEHFLVRAASGARFEVEASRLALAKATHQDVKAFAQQVGAFHEIAADKLGQAAIASGHMPAQTGLDEAQLRKLNDLKLSEGADFDTLYVEQQLAAYSEIVALFARFSTQGDGGPIQAFAQEALPVLEAHLSHVRGLKATPLTSFLEVPVSSLERKTPHEARLGFSSPSTASASS